MVSRTRLGSRSRTAAERPGLDAQPSRRMVRPGQGVLTTGTLPAPFADHRPVTGVTLTLGALLGAAGVACILGSERLGSNLSPFPKTREGGRLVQDGVFALVRHPIYTGFIIFTLGWSLL